MVPYFIFFLFSKSHKAIDPSAEPVAKSFELLEKEHTWVVLESECRKVATVCNQRVKLDKF